MGLSFLDVVGSFAQGVQERGAEIDKEIADRIKELNSKKEDSNLKSRYTEEYKKFEEDKELIKSIEAAGGIGKLKGMQIAGGYDSFAEFKEALDLDPTLITSIKMPTIGKEPIYTPASYGLTNKTEDGKTRSTVSKMFNAAFRPEVYEKNEEFADSQVDTEETMTTYRRGKGTDITSAQEKNLRTSLQMSRLKDKPQQLNKKIQKEDGGWQEVTFTRNENGTTGNKAKELGGIYSLYAGYSVTNTQPWQDPTKQKDGTTFDYVKMFAVDSNGDFISDDDLTRSDMKQVPVSVKAVKTGDPKDKIQIQGGMLEGYKYLQRDIIPAEKETDGRTADMQNLDAEVEQFIAMYNASPERKELMDKKLVAMGLPPGEMTELAARELLINFKSFEQNVNSGNFMNVQDMWLGVGDSTSQNTVFDPVQPNDVSSYTQEYLPTQSYYNALKDSFAYEVFINTQSQYFANKHKVPISTAVNVIEKIAKTGVTNESGDFVNFLSKFNITNPLVFDQNRKVLGPDTVSTLISQLEKYKKEIEADPRSQGQTASWSRVTDIVLNKIAAAQQ
jgi:hypothetical protein